MQRFHDGKVQALVMNPQAAGTGFNLVEAHTTIYYSNDFNLGNRFQSEARNHRPGQKNVVTYYDLVARNTVDEKILGSLRDKIEMAAKLNGDELSDWLKIGVDKK